MNVKAVSLTKLVKDDCGFQAKAEGIANISELIYKFKETFKQENVLISDLEYFAWQRVEKRMKRTRRLIELGAPKIIIENEGRWFLLMIDHMEKIFNEVFPVYTLEEREEIHSLIELEESLEEG